MVLGAWFCLGFSALTAQGVFESIGQEVNNLFEKVKPSIVKIRSDNGLLTLVGSGFYIDQKGTILTSAMIVADDTATSVELDGVKLDAQVIGKDVRSGLALLRVYNDGKTPFLTFGNSSQLKPATAVVGVGYPYNLPVAPSFGLVGGFDVQYLNRFFATTHIRVNLPISPGQVGGPLLNTKGEVIGIMVMSVENGKSCYALPSLAAQKIINELQTTGAARQGWVGVGVADRNPAEPNQGVMISKLFDHSPAPQSGLQIGDVLLRIGTKEIRHPSDVIDVSFFSKVGETLPVVVSRSGKVMNFKLAVHERPTSLPAVIRTENPTPAPSTTSPIIRLNDSTLSH